MIDILQVTDPGCCGGRLFDEDGCCVTCGRDFLDPDTGEEVGDGTRVPNARLVATAYDLLEALERVAEDDFAHDAKDVVLAALAKAKGKSG